MEISKSDMQRTFEKVKLMTLKEKDEGYLRLLHDIFPRVRAYKKQIRKKC